jgi:UDP-N-acetylmuramate--alanine ligase
MKRVHLIGIGGSGLSAIARLLLESGYSVSGSDVQISPLALQLQNAGAQVVLGHRADNILGADVVVRSSAIKDDNPEVRAAWESGLPVLKRAEFIGELTEGKMVVAVAGTHGKTTTTAMISWILTSLGMDPSYLIGGYSLNMNTNAHAGKGEVFVIEADEYDRMFLGLKPKLAIITNIEHDHPDCYPTRLDFYAAFVEFVNQLSPTGTLIASSDDYGAAELLQEKNKIYKTLSYGINARHEFKPDYHVKDLILNESGCFDYDFSFRDQPLVRVRLSVPGMHNVQNSMAALAVVHLLEQPLKRASESLAEFSGTGRRFEIRGEVNGVTIVDDYAHHPSEIQATLSAARQRFPMSEIWAVWQPHTYSRTRVLFDGFVSAFTGADHVVVTEVFASRETPDPNFSAEAIVRAMHHPDVKFIPNLPDVSEFLLARLKSGDVLVILSAGDTEVIIEKIFSALSSNGRSDDVYG